jgi:hypothetical protein
LLFRALAENHALRIPPGEALKEALGRSG